jgi:hypothetical protein
MPSNRRREGSPEALTVSGVAGALVTVGIWAAKQFGGVEVPAMLAAPLTTLASALGLGFYRAGRWFIERR